MTGKGYEGRGEREREMRKLRTHVRREEERKRGKRRARKCWQIKGKGEEITGRAVGEGSRWI